MLSNEETGDIELSN